MAAALWARCQLLGDGAYNDIETHGDNPVDPDEAWIVFSDFPRITWRQTSAWRRQCARAFDDLAGDLAAGHWPLPTCPAEEMALHLAVQANQELDDEWLEQILTTMRTTRRWMASRIRIPTPTPISRSGTTVHQLGFIPFGT